MNIGIIYEDDNLLIVDKPAGITVNRSETTRHEITVQDWAAPKIGIEDKEIKVSKDLPYDPVQEFKNRGGIVHRLDKETSGVLILAKNPETFTDLQRQFKEREVRKVYVAFAHGKVPQDGEISVPVGRLPWNRNRFGILPGGRESKTLYKTLEYYENKKTKEILSYVELYPQSGRTHQIRVHLKYIGHPIFSDFLYAGRKTARNDRKILPRVFLHAAKISFSHPKTKEILEFVSSLPKELKLLLQKFSE